MDELMHLAFEQAAKSPAKKRKVGAVISFADFDGSTQAAVGYNYNPQQRECEDANGNTLPDVVHAEVAAINYFERNNMHLGMDATVLPRLRVTHQPCENCLDKFFQFVRKYWSLQSEDIDMRTLVIVANTGMKFDADKIRFDLIPPIATEALAAVLTYGAKKYKPNNWRSVDPERYVAAFERHWHAFISGELFDKESGLPHLAHCMTNLAFLLELNYKPELQQRLADYCKNS